jgi:hypothetical protein
MAMRIDHLKKYRGRNPLGYFRDLPWDARQRAYGWLGKFCEKWGSNLPPWRLAILVGQAKRLALMSDTERSVWGRKMLAKRGGYAVQRMYRAEGHHPTQKATLTRTQRQAAVKKARQPGFSRSSFGDLTGI